MAMKYKYSNEEKKTKWDKILLIKGNIDNGKNKNNVEGVAAWRQKFWV